MRRNVLINLILTAGVSLGFAGAPHNLFCAEIRWTVRGETGVHRFNETGGADVSEPFVQLDNRLTYENRQNNALLRWQMRFIPTFYDVNLADHSLKLSTTGLYQVRQNDNQWGLQLSLARNAYALGDLTLAYTQFDLGGLWSRRLTPKTVVNATLDYVFRDVDNHSQNRHDDIRGEVGFSRSYSSFGQWGGGLYLEKFQIRHKITTGLFNLSEENRGWRVGPTVRFDYRRKVVIGASYRALWHQADAVKAGSSEHWLRLMLGKMLNRRTTAHFLADYYWRDLKRKPGVHPGALYSALENESAAYVQLLRELSARADFYIKLGYQRESLLSNNRSLTGWRVGVGLELH